MDCQTLVDNFEKMLPDIRKEVGCLWRKRWLEDLHVDPIMKQYYACLAASITKCVDAIMVNQDSDIVKSAINSFEQSYGKDIHWIFLSSGVAATALISMRGMYAQALNEIYDDVSQHLLS